MKKEITISNQFEETKQISQLIEEFGSLLNIASKTIMSMDLAIVEITAYIIEHCYSQGESSLIEFQIEVSPNTLIFRLTDKGAVFNPFLKNETNIQNKLDERLAKGLGQFLIHRTMDEVTYQSTDTQNTLTLTKQLDVKSKSATNLVTNICKVDNFIVLDINGRLDTNSAAEFNTTIQPLLEEERPNIIINCEQLSYISSLGLRSFLLLQKHIQRKQGNLVIEAMQPEIKHIFEMTGCATLFRID